ncbi:MAG: hypothetical protein M0035_17995 [Actinomycetota bacterium]|nr:hypothetical protein [Actinomycetota bacterium]
MTGSSGVELCVDRQDPGIGLDLAARYSGSTILRQVDGCSPAEVARIVETWAVV